MKNIVILDLDGVLITTPNWKPDSIHTDGYSDFNKKAVGCFNKLMDGTKAELWLSSSRRKFKTVKEFNEIFANRNIKPPIVGFLPVLEYKSSRKEEIIHFITNQQIDNLLILDDDSSLEALDNVLKKYWVKTAPLIGFDEEKLLDAQAIVSDWLL